MLNRILTVALLFGAALGGGPQSPQAEPYRHDRFNTQPVDVARKFLAFSVSFDGSDDGIAMGVPEWVAYELRATPPNLTTAPDRPSTWVTDNDLFVKKIAPADASYAGSGYSRGHMCMKSHANRMSALADKETHTVLNACPQAQSMNAGSWLAIENLCGNWADTYGRVWIITGPVILANNPAKWIGDPGEVPVRVPDAFFKIVVRDSSETPEVLAFLVPMEGDESHSRQSADVRPYLTSVDIVEALTGLDFLTDIPDPLETHLEQRIYTTLWGTPVPVIADRQLPTPPAKTTARQAERTTDGGELRGGSSPTATEEALAKKLQSEGWVYIMPQPKSAQAAWGNKDGRTTWFNGSWKNSKTGRSSTEQPSESDGYQGDRNATHSSLILNPGKKFHESALRQYSFMIVSAGWQWAMASRSGRSAMATINGGHAHESSSTGFGLCAMAVASPAIQLLTESLRTQRSTVLSDLVSGLIDLSCDSHPHL